MTLNGQKSRRLNRIITNTCNPFSSVILILIIIIFNDVGEIDNSRKLESLNKEREREPES